MGRPPNGWFFLGGGGGVKNETRDLAHGSLHFTTFYNMFFVMSYFWLGGTLNVTYNLLRLLSWSAAF